MDDRWTVESACPICGDIAVRQVYFIGSGPELSCATCEWCWGAEGQLLNPIPVDLRGVPEVLRRARGDATGKAAEA